MISAPTENKRTVTENEKCRHMEALTSSIDETIFKKWKHEGFVGVFSSEYANFEIDGKEYILRLIEVRNEDHWSGLKDGDWNKNG